MQGAGIVSRSPVFVTAGLAFWTDPSTEIGGTVRVMMVLAGGKVVDPVKDALARTRVATSVGSRFGSWYPKGCFPPLTILFAEYYALSYAVGSHTMCK